MATTTNYGWTTPDDTALVKDGAAAIRSLGSAIDTTTKNLNPGTTNGDIDYYATGTTKSRVAIGSSGQCLTVVAGVPSWAASATSVLTTTGDLLYASAANTLARRAIGSTGDVLTVSGGLPTWAAPASAATNYSLLNTGGTALTGAATITVSGISSRDKIFVLIVGASSANASSIFSLRFNSDSTAKYGYANSYYTISSSYAAGNFTTDSNTGTATRIDWAGMGNGTTDTANGYFNVLGCNSSGVKVFSYGGSATGTLHQDYSGGGFYSGTSTISSVSVISSTGNFDAGTIFVYTSANQEK